MNFLKRSTVRLAQTRSRLLCWITALQLTSAGWAGAQVLIDNFDKGQGPLTSSGLLLSTATGSMLGGERDAKLTVTSGSPITLEAKGGVLSYQQDASATGSAELVWDGPDGTALTIDATGLGGVDLTAGGQDALFLGITSCNQPLTVTLTIYSSSGNRSATVVLSASDTPNNYRVSYAAFSGLGSFAAVGAVQLTINNSPGADLKIDFLRTTSSTAVPPLEATLTDVFLTDNDGNGVVSAGDTLRYVVRITNNDVTAKTGVQFNAPTPDHTTLGAITASPVAKADGPPSTSSIPGQAFHGAFNSTLNVPSVSGLLANDFLGSPAATIASFGGGSLGGVVTDHLAGGTGSSSGHALTVNADGSLTFVPAAGFTGLFTFQYRLSNAAGSSEATATIAIGLRPAATPDSYTVTGNIANSQSASNGVLQKPVVDTGDALRVTTFGPNIGGVGTYSAGSTGVTAQGGDLIVQADGSFSYDPPAGFTGSDSFVYQIDNGFNQPQSASVTLTVSGMIWFINNAGGPGNGRLSSPFNSLAAFIAVNDGASLHPQAGDSIFLYTGSEIYTGTTAPGLVMLNQQKLIGQGAQVSDLGTATGLTFAPGSGTLPSLHGTNPVIGNSVVNGNGITLASDNTLRGITIGNTANGFGLIGSAVGNVTILDCSKTGSGGAISISTSGAFGSNVSFDTLESIGSVDANLNLVNITGTLAVTSGGSGLGLSAITAPAINISGGSVSFNYPGVVDKSNNNALLSVSGGHTGSLTFTGLLTAEDGTGLQFSNASGVYQFNGTTTLNGGNAGVAILNGSGGTFSLNASTSITSPTGTAFNVSGGSPTVTYAGSIIQNHAQRVVNIDSTLTHTIAFTGSIAGGAASTGINLNNVDGNVSFTTLTMGTSGSRITHQAVTINGGTGSYDLGAVSIFANNVTGLSALNADGSILSSSGTVDAGQGAAINIDGPLSLTTLGMTLTRVVSSGGSVNGITLQNTDGSFTITGDGTDTSLGGNGTGGILASKIGSDGSNLTGMGLYLRNVAGVTLRRMQIHDHQNFGIRGAQVTDFTLEYSTVNGSNGTTTSPVIVDGYSIAGEASISFNDLLGQASLRSCLIEGGINDNVTVVNASGTLNALAMNGCTIQANGATTGNDGVHIEAQGTANMTLNIGSISANTFAAHRGDHIQVSTLTTTSTVTFNFIGNTLSGGHPNPLGQGLTLDGIGNTTYTISNNTLNGSIGTALNVVMLTGGTQTFSGNIANNTIGTSGLSNSGSAQGSAIVLELNGDGTHSVTVSNNTLRQWGNGPGLFLQKRNSSSAASALNAKITGNTISEPGASAGNGILVNSGTTSADAGTTCVDIGGAGALANSLAGNSLTSSTDFRVRQRFNTTVHLPGYGGLTTDDAAVISFIQARNSSSPTGSATHDVSTGGGGFLGGAACPTP